MLVCMNRQTSFLTPPFGWALFFLKGIAPAGYSTRDIYVGVMPYIFIQVCALAVLMAFPQLALWLPTAIDWVI